MQKEVHATRFSVQPKVREKKISPQLSVMFLINSHFSGRWLPNQVTAGTRVPELSQAAPETQGSFDLVRQWRRPHTDSLASSEVGDPDMDSSRRKRGWGLGREGEILSSVLQFRIKS